MLKKSDYHILVVDDEKDILDFLKELIEDSGFKVESAPDGEAAWDIIQSKRLNLFLVLSDVKMPHLDGVGLLNKIKANLPDIPVVMIMSGFSDVKKQEFLDKGALAFFNKPFDEATIEKVINEEFANFC